MNINKYKECCTYFLFWVIPQKKEYNIHKTAKV